MRLRGALAPLCSRPQRAKGPRARAGAAAVSTLLRSPFRRPPGRAGLRRHFAGLGRFSPPFVRSHARCRQRPRLPPAWNEDCCGSPRGGGRAFDGRIRSGGGAGHLRASRAGRVGRGRRPPLRERRVAGHHAPSRRPDVRLRRREGAGRSRPRDARPHPKPRDPAGLDGRLDLPGPARPPPGDRPRRAGPQAVPLSPAVARASATRRSSTGWSPSRAALPRIRARVERDLARPRPAAARRCSAARRAAARADAHPRRQRGVRPARTARSA